MRTNRRKQYLEQSIESRLSALPRERPNQAKRWADKALGPTARPGMDLRNVLLGYSSRISTTAQVNHGFSSLQALPIGHNAFGNTGVGILIQQNLDHLGTTIDNTITYPSTRADIYDPRTTLTNTDAIAEIFGAIGTEFGRTPDKYGPPFNRALEYITMKARREFDARHPLNIDSHDSTETIKQKVEAHNKRFEQEMKVAKAQLKQELGSGVSLAAITRATKYCNDALSAAAKYQGDFKYQKDSLYEHTVRTANALTASDPEKQIEKAESEIDLANQQLRDIIADVPVGPQRTAVEWAINEQKAAAKYQETRSDQDYRALLRIRSNRPTDFDSHRQVVSTHLRKAQPALKKFKAYQAVKLRAVAMKPDFDRAERMIQLESNLDNEVTDYVSFNRRQNLAEEKSYVELLVLDHINTKNPTPENQKKFDKAKEAWEENNHPALYIRNTQRNKPIRHSDNGVHRYIKIVAAERIAIQKLPTANRHVTELAEAKLQYTASLSSLSSVLKDDDSGHELANPSPALIKRLQQEGQSLRHQYRSKVESIHKEAGTLDTLKAVSKPLNALRDANQSFKGLFNPKQSAARLDVLDTAKYEVSGATLPRQLVLLNNLTEEVNKLLDEREKLESIIEADPSSATRYASTLRKNTTALQSKMKDLQQAIEKAERSELIQSHPDVEAYTRKASALFDDLNRSFLQKHRWANAGLELLRTKPGINIATRFLDGRGHVDHVKGINTIKYNPMAGRASAADTTTEYFEKTGTLTYSKKTHTAMIKQADGTEKRENIIFSRAELQGHFEDFIEKHGLEVGRGSSCIKVSKSGNKISYQWPNKETKQKWLEYTAEKYKEKRADELKVPQATSASVGIQNPANDDDDSSMIARGLQI